MTSKATDIIKINGSMGCGCYSKYDKKATAGVEIIICDYSPL